MRELHRYSLHTNLTKLLVLSCLLVLGPSQIALAQLRSTGAGSSDSSLLPPSPQGHVLDDADLFREHPEKLAEIKQRLKRMEKDHGYPVYLSIYYNVYDGNLQARADALHKSWIGESSRGMMIVYQLDPVVTGNNPAITYYKGSDLDSDMSADPDRRLISGQEVAAMLTRVFDTVKKEDNEHIPLISSLIEGIEGEINRYHEVQPASWTDKENLNLMTVFLSIIAVLALLGMLVWKLFSRADAKSNKSHYFPEVKVGRRLDAPFGGGWISEKTFVPASSRR